ncbi:MAG: hypothetical protein WCY29_05985 [Novosphingobium sp.]
MNTKRTVRPSVARLSAISIRSGAGRSPSNPVRRFDEALPGEIETGAVWRAPDPWASRYAAAMIAAGHVDSFR